MTLKSSAYASVSYSNAALGTSLCRQSCFNSITIIDGSDYANT